MSRHTVGLALMGRSPLTTSDSDLRRAAHNLPPVEFVSGNQPQKDAARSELARQLADFERRGGRVQVLGNTALKPGKSRREATTERAQKAFAS